MAHHRADVGGKDPAVVAFVRQRLRSDCGIAALAMLCDVDYEKAKGAIAWRKKGTYSIRTKQLRDGAMVLGYRTEGTPENRLKLISAPPGWPKKIDYTIWSLIPDNSLVKLPQLLGARGWHWVVWRKGKIYDPVRGVFTPIRYGDRYPSSYMRFIKKEDDNVRIDV